MKHYVNIIIILLLIFNIGNAQESVTIKETKQAQLNNKLGFAGSMFSGYGLSYEYNVSQDFTLEFTGSIYGSGGNSNNFNDNSYIMMTLGSELQKNWFTSQDSRFYTFLGISYWLDNTNYNYNNTKTDKNDYVGGLGLGWEFTFGKKIIFNIEGGYLYRDMNSKGNELIYDPLGGKENLQPFSRHSYYLGFGIGGGIYYSF